MFWIVFLGYGLFAAVIAIVFVVITVTIIFIALIFLYERTC
jgi:hypothetical protein